MRFKCFLLHVSRFGTELYTDSFFSRTALAAHLRGIGLHFTNSDLSELGESSLKLYGRDGLVYEIEEIDPPTSPALHIEGKLFLPISDFCRETGMSKSTVFKSFRRGEIPGLYVGRNNRIYLYWRDADE